MNALEEAAVFSDIFTTSANAQELCTRLTFSQILADGKVGTSLWALDRTGSLRAVSRFGQLGLVLEGMSIWEQNEAASALRELNWSSSVDNGLLSVVMPLVKGEQPQGAIVFTWAMRPDLNVEPNQYSVQFISTLGGYYLRSTGLTSTGEIELVKGNNALTERQLAILEVIGHKTNAEIASRLLLSESTIRQETVRIYRSLGVKTRTEASKKAKALGLIQGGLATE